MRKREFNNRMSLRGEDNINTVIAPSGHARSSDLRISNIIKRLIGRFLEFFALQKIGVTFIMWILISSTSITVSVRAECVPTPNCAEIGYTATSCDGDSLKCPFDTSKLFCIPCDTSFKYLCSGAGQVGTGAPCNGKYTACTCQSTYKYTCSGAGYSSGSGSSCDGKYTSCNCSGGYTWNGSACVLSCTSSSSDYCWVHGTCHGDCCSDGSIPSCDPQCGGSGCNYEPIVYDCPVNFCNAIGGTHNGEGCSRYCHLFTCECGCAGAVIDGYCTTDCAICTEEA